MNAADAHLLGFRAVEPLEVVVGEEEGLGDRLDELVLILRHGIGLAGGLPKNESWKWWGNLTPYKRAEFMRCAIRELDGQRHALREEVERWKRECNTDRDALRRRIEADVEERHREQCHRELCQRSDNYELRINLLVRRVEELEVRRDAAIRRAEEAEACIKIVDRAIRHASPSEFMMPDDRGVIPIVQRMAARLNHDVSERNRIKRELDDARDRLRRAERDPAAVAVHVKAEIGDGWQGGCVSGVAEMRQHCEHQRAENDRLRARVAELEAQVAKSADCVAVDEHDVEPFEAWRAATANQPVGNTGWACSHASPDSRCVRSQVGGGDRTCREQWRHEVLSRGDAGKGAAG